MAGTGGPGSYARWLGGAAVNRAIRLIIGPEQYAPFVATPVAQAYQIDLAMPFNFKITQIIVVLSAGTLTLNLQTKIGTGALTSVTGMSAIAVTSTSQTILAPTDGTEWCPINTLMQMTLSALAATPANLAVAVRVQRQ